jgi:hypothetical protein
MGHRHSKESNVGTTIHNDCILGQSVNDGKDIVQFRFDMSAACFDQGFGLEQTSPGHNELAVHTV